MPAITRIGVDLSAGHCFAPRAADNGSPNVYVNNISAVRIGDHYPSHSCGSVSHDGFASGGSPTVFVNDLPVHRIGDDISCGDTSAAGSPNVFAGSWAASQGDQVSLPTVDTSIAGAADNAAFAGDEIDDGTPQGKAQAQAFNQLNVSNGLYSVTDLRGPIVAGPVDTKESTNVQPQLLDCAGFSGQTTFANSFMLTDVYSLGNIVAESTFPHAVVANKGLTAAQIVCNLKMLTLNCWTPIKSYYSNAFITSSFRPGANEKQHGDGCAMDIQFRGASKAEYFAIAKMIRDYVPFDRLLLEYKTTGTKMPWIHVSFKKDGLNRYVFTFMNNIKYANGLVDLSQS